MVTNIASLSTDAG